MNYLKQITLIVLVSVTILSSCSIEKRHYMSGYNIEWKTNKHISAQEKPTRKPESKLNESTKENNSVSEVRDENLIASLDSSVEVISQPILSENNFNIKSNTAKKSYAEECDVMVLTNGDEQKVKVIKIGTEEIEYKKCDNLNGPNYTIKKRMSL